ncbi:unnamed protein product [Adineta steineri]|uniref:G-protein coupled receptors family 1 profile domain-containing protein n=1 Tax=Adineta steineri TaxID=433720 RepID=A0A814BKR9_9BILA|nr:unnamed protein product [Adineta steineri]CAF3492788.1 unnamed protein product [Adineta steineri]CAF3679485.1 unnamed protein product [Adineta steineri]
MYNGSIIQGGGWDPTDLAQNNIIFGVCVVAAILHTFLWSQLIMRKIKFDITLLFSLGYISTDIFLLFFYFIAYAIRIRSWIPITLATCYFEAYAMFYFNILETYSLMALNISRYWQIVRNPNTYIDHRKMIIVSCIITPFLVAINLIIQDILGWSVLYSIPGSSCNVSFTNIPIQVWNMTIMLVIPIVLSFCLLFRAFRFLQSAQAGQLHIRRNHHRKVTIQTLIFYSFWFILWLPGMIVNCLDSDYVDGTTNFIVILLSTIETLCDPIVGVFLDKRIAQAWKKSYKWMRRQSGVQKSTKVTPAVEIKTAR